MRVAVLDTGISMYHPDRGNVVASVSYVIEGYTGATVPVEDFDTHGTHTSGTIAAADRLRWNAKPAVHRGGGSRRARAVREREALVHAI